MAVCPICLPWTYPSSRAVSSAPFYSFVILMTFGQQQLSSRSYLQMIPWGKMSKLTQYVDVELQKIDNWVCSNKMSINASKTKFIVFRARGKVTNPLDCQLVYNGNDIGKPVIPELVYTTERIHNESLTLSFKLLGVLFDEYLTFDEHIAHLCTKISKSVL
jgi:hypothetical protein